MGKSLQAGIINVRKSVVLFSVVLTLVLTAFAGASAYAGDTGMAAPQPGQIVGTDPTTTTPGVQDGKVNTIAKVGNTIIVGGSFTTVRNPGSTVDIARRNIFAFNATTGQVSTTFAPNPSSTVYKVLPAADGTSAYVGGQFTQVTSGGATVSANHLYKVDVATGAKIPAFNAGSWNGQVRDLELVGNRLFVGGKFTTVAGHAQVALASVNATSGAFDAFVSNKLAGLHNTSAPSGVTDVLQLATDPQGQHLVIVGNFLTVDGQGREQIAMFNIGGASSTLANWYTTMFEANCSLKFDTYMTDVEYSPGGDFFVVSTTGAYGGSASLTSSSGCDVVVRFESSTSGTNVRPTWAAYTGGDTTWTVEVTNRVVYVGGHQRWQNNPTAGDQAGQGAVSRPGIAALDAINGMPFSWNPTRTRGEGVQDMLATTDGLYVGSDTEIFANKQRKRIAFVPLSGGKTLPVDPAPSLPGEVYTVPTGSGQLQHRSFDGTSGGSISNVNGATGFGSAVGAFMIQGTLYTAYSNGTFTKRSFNGTTLGAETTINVADQLVFQSDWHNQDVPSITSFFYTGGRMYFTRNGQNTLYSRGFEREDDVVGQLRYTSAAPSGITYSTMRGATVVGNKMYYVNTSGALFSATWNGTAPVGGTQQQISSSGWANHVFFLFS
jgi:hypothetical protein